jgi:hypothetical protein
MKRHRNVPPLTKEILAGLVQVCPVTGCWIVPSIQYPRYAGQALYHLVHELYKGPVPDDLMVRHVPCETKQCCNPDHLILGTQSENAADTWKNKKEGRRPNIRHGHIGLELRILDDLFGPCSMSRAECIGRVVVCHEALRTHFDGDMEELEKWLRLPDSEIPADWKPCIYGPGPRYRRRSQIAA